MKTIRTALIQFDAKPESPKENLGKMADLVGQATEQQARWIMFHEGTVCDYTPRLSDFAEPVPGGESTQAIINLSKEYNCFISFGLSEVDEDRYYITQVFTGPAGLVYRYRKTWLWREPGDEGYRNEWTRYDPGAGPELFNIDGVKATCFICADGDALRCVNRSSAIKPQVIFYPNNRHHLPEFDLFGKIASTIGAPMLVTNRTGQSWIHDCMGGCVIYSASGEVLAKANRQGKEEILIYDLEF